MIRWIRRVLPRWHTAEGEVDEELQLHLQLRTEELISSGMDPAAARRSAEQQFGNLRDARNELVAIDQSRARQLLWSSLVTDLRGDLRFGLRVLVRSPGFALSALVILGLAIGGNTAAFTLFRTVLLTRLPYDHPGQLVHLWEGNTRSAGGRSEASWPNFFDWRTGTTSFTALEGYDESNFSVAGDQGAARVQGGQVTAGFFDLLGVTPLLGRSFRPDDEVPGGAPVALVSYGFWQTRFGAVGGILDSSLAIDGRSYRVIGVLPRQFRFGPVGDAAIWLPVDPADPTRQMRFNHRLRVIGRLHEGVSAVQAKADLNLVMGRLAEQYPETNQGRTALVIPLAEEITGPSRPLLIALLAAMSLVLAIAGANIAGLMLTRAVAREEEILVRSALGASRVRLLRQLLIESLILAGLGGVLGIAVAYAGLPFLVAVLPGDLKAQLTLASVLDRTILGYTSLITLLTGIGFGLGPMLHVFRANPTNRLKGARGGTAARGALRLRDGLIVTQIALTMTLLAGSTLLGRSIAALFQVDLGFRVEDVATLRVALSGPGYDQAEPQQRFFETLLGEVRAIPGVQSAGAISNLPLEGGGTLTFHVEGEPELPAAARSELVSRGVAGDYFQTLQVPLQAGRVLTREDDTTRQNTVLVDESTAREFFPGGQAVGKRVRFYAFPQTSWEVAGVVGDMRTGPLDQPFRHTVYFSHLQSPENRMSLVVRSSLAPAELINRIRKLAIGLDRDAAVYAERTLDRQVSGSAAIMVRRLSLSLIGLCAGLALVLSVVGLYGVVAFAVVRRSRELGIRAALGAAPRALERLVMRHGLVLTFVGSALGVGLSLALAGTIRALLFGVSVSDPATYVLTAALLLGVTGLASWLPARRATRTDPATVLRGE